MAGYPYGYGAGPYGQPSPYGQNPYGQPMMGSMGMGGPPPGAYGQPMMMGGGGPPIMNQPMRRPMMGMQWSPPPAEIPPNCPPGLEYLSLVNHIFVKQNIEPFEIATGYETANSYQILNNFGHRMFFAMEESDPCLRQCMAQRRPFKIHLFDSLNREVMVVTRPCKCCTCACCNESKVMIEAPPGVPIGIVREECVCCYDSFAGVTQAGISVMHIRKHCCMCSWCAMVEFEVYDGKYGKIGEVKKLWSGIVQESISDADTFGISFPVGLDVHAKAVMLGACFLIDFMYFET